jgi:hypothetical protein
MCLVLSVYVTDPMYAISFALLGINVDQTLDVITALVTHTGRAYEVA